MDNILVQIAAAIIAVGGILTAIERITGLQVGILPVVRFLRRRLGGTSVMDGDRPQGVDELAWATQMLAKTTTEQWENEARRLGLIRGEGEERSASLIRIGWTIDRDRLPRDAGDAISHLDAVWRANNPKVDDLADFFNASPVKRMVLLGTAQAGKSAAAVLLTLDLLYRRTPTDPVPVKFSLAQWDHDLSLETWLTQRLLDDHRGFRDKKTYGDKIVSRLLKEGLVLPILDGLDELPGKRKDSNQDERSRVVAEINKHKIKLKGLILTCQEQIYDDLDYPLDEAVIVKLADVSTEEAHRYLDNAASRSSRDRERYRPVLEELKAKPGGNLAAVLRSPLMVYLVPKVYFDVHSTPAELLDDTKHRDPKAIEEHLLRAFLPAVFPDGPGSPPWRGSDAMRWLGNIAAQLEKKGRESGTASTRFGWWDLSTFGRPATARAAGVVGGLAGGLAVGLAFTALFVPLAGLVTGVPTAILLGYYCWRNEPPRPSDAQTRPSRIRSIVKSGLAIGVIVFAGGTIARDVDFGIRAGIVFGLLIALLYGSTEPDPTLRPLDPRLLLRRDIAVGIRFGLMYGVPAGITGWFLSGNPVLSVAIGITAGLAGALLYGPIWILAALAQVGGVRKRLDAIGVVAFVHLAFAIAYFAPRHKLPWRVMAFLHSAHELGVLRLVSGSYEFRHQDLQRVLAAEYLRSTEDGRV